MVRLTKFPQSPQMHDGDLSFRALAASRTFVAAAERDVHILVESFALTWSWLDNGTSDMRWQYGAFVVFERVWCTNGWSRVDAALGSESGTREAIYDIICAALCSKITDADQPLHAIGAAMAFYLLAKTSRARQRLAIDVCAYLLTATYRALLELPEKARAVLDVPAPSSDLPPPSADVHRIILLLLGQGQSREQMVEVRLPNRIPRATPLTDSVPRDQRGKSVGTEETAASRRSTSAHTASALDMLADAQADYMHARTGLAQWASIFPGWLPTETPQAPDTIAHIASQVRSSLG